MTERNNLYPVFVKLEKLNVLIVGAGYVGNEKLNSILDNCPEAKISVIADRVSDEVSNLAARHSNVRLTQRKFEWADLDKKDLVFLATNDPELHKKISKVTRAKNILTNVADTPGLCDFYLSSIVQKGNLKIGISTNGKSPTVAKRIRQMLNDIIPENINTLLNNLHVVRNHIKGDFNKKVEILNHYTRSLIENKNYRNLNEN